MLADASGASLGPFVAGSVEPGSRVITDGWVGYNGLAALGYAHERRNQKAAARRGQDPGELLPAVHRVSSLCKRWLLGTHQGRVEPAHLQAYLNEFAFRFNRRHSRSRGMVFYRVLELAAGHDPVRYDDIRATRKPRSKPPQQRGTGHPPSLDRPAADVSRGSNAHDILGVAAIVGVQSIGYQELYPGAGEKLPGEGA